MTWETIYVAIATAIIAVAVERSWDAIAMRIKNRKLAPKKTNVPTTVEPENDDLFMRPLRRLFTTMVFCALCSILFITRAVIDWATIGFVPEKLEIFISATMVSVFVFIRIFQSIRMFGPAHKAYDNSRKNHSDGDGEAVPDES